jgi:hypothetical protein
MCVIGFTGELVVDGRLRMEGRWTIAWETGFHCCQILLPSVLDDGLLVT